MITSKYDWQLASPSADEAFLVLAKKAGLEASVATYRMSVAFRPKRI